MASASALLDSQETCARLVCHAMTAAQNCNSAPPLCCLCRIRFVCENGNSCPQVICPSKHFIYIYIYIINNNSFKHNNFFDTRGYSTDHHSVEQPRYLACCSVERNLIRAASRIVLAWPRCPETEVTPIARCRGRHKH